MINAAELASLQAEELLAMPDTAVILRRIGTNSSGGTGGSYLPVGTTRCRVTASLAANEPIIAAELASLTRYQMVVPDGTDIRPSDRIVYSGKTFEIQGGSAVSSWNMSEDWFLTEILR